jgi:proton-dependent oligopeptide transporter, POT family
MAAPAPATATEFNPPPAGEILGHPRALWNLFGAEFWERFCYYGMRAMLAAHVATQFFSHLGDGAKSAASLTYGGFTSMVYMTAILGGFVADRILGYQRSILLGGAIMATGMFMLMAPDLTTFLMGLAVIIVGNGLFKPNISTMVGKLYAPGDARRDGGFTIFYMGINAGAFFAPLICAGVIGAKYGYGWGFVTAAIGMIFGLAVFQFLRSWLGHVGASIEGKKGWGPVFQVLAGAAVMAVPVYFLLSQSDILGGVLVVMLIGLAGYFVFSGIQSGEKEQLHKYIAMLILFVGNMVFWALFEQAGSSLNFLAEEHVNMPQGDWLPGFIRHFSVFQSVNAVFIVAIAPVFAGMWPALDKKGMNPSIPRKFAIGLVMVAAGFALLVFAIKSFTTDGSRISWVWLTLTYLIHTMAELCISPIGLSMVTKLARPQETGLAMGGWFLSIAVANYAAGKIAAIATGGGHEATATTAKVVFSAGEKLSQYSDVFLNLTYGGLVIGATYFVLAPLINKLMHGVK